MPLSLNNILLLRRKIVCTSGKGGNGALSRLPTSRPKGRGGNGGSILVQGNVNIYTLKNLAPSHVIAPDGNNGHLYSRGARGQNIVLPVPYNSLISYVTEDGDKIESIYIDSSDQHMLIEGGRGGFGSGNGTDGTKNDNTGFPGSSSTIQIDLFPSSTIHLISPYSWLNNMVLQHALSCRTCVLDHHKSLYGFYIDQDFNRVKVVSSTFDNDFYRQALRNARHNVLVIDDTLDPDRYLTLLDEVDNLTVMVVAELDAMSHQDTRIVTIPYKLITTSLIRETFYSIYKCT